MDQADLAKRAEISVETIKRLERLDGPLAGARAGTLAALQRALEAAGVLFLEENGEGPGVRLRKRRRGKQSIPVEDLTAENDE